MDTDSTTSSEAAPTVRFPWKCPECPNQFRTSGTPYGHLYCHATLHKICNRCKDWFQRNSRFHFENCDLPENLDYVVWQPHVLPRFICDPYKFCCCICPRIYKRGLTAKKCHKKGLRRRCEACHRPKCTGKKLTQHQKACFVRRTLQRSRGEQPTEDNGQEEGFIYLDDPDGYASLSEEGEGEEEEEEEEEIEEGEDEGEWEEE